MSASMLPETVLVWVLEVVEVELCVERFVQETIEDLAWCFE